MADEPQYRSVYANSAALLIGINAYSDPRFVPLGNAEGDAQKLAEALQSPLFGFKTTLLLGAAATKQAILSELFKLRSTKPDDRVLVYFAGHGYTLKDRFDNEEGYLAAADTVPEQDFTALGLEEVLELSRYAPAKHIGFIFDACFSGQALGLTRAPSVSVDKLLTRRAYQVLSAGAGDQTVSDFQSMTTYMLDVLKDKTQIMKDGAATFNELGLYLQQTITSESGQTQIPQFGHIKGSQGGDLVLFTSQGPQIPYDLEEALGSDLINLRLAAVIELVEIAKGEDDALTTIAKTRLQDIARTDESPAIRAGAASYFLEQEALKSGKKISTAQKLARKLERGATEDAAVKEVLKDAFEDGSPIFDDALIPPPDPTKAKPKRSIAEPRAEAAPAAAQPVWMETLKKLPMPWRIGAGAFGAVGLLALILMTVLNPQASLPPDPTPTLSRTPEPTETQIPEPTNTPTTVPIVGEVLPPPTDTPTVTSAPTEIPTPTATEIPILEVYNVIVGASQLREGPAYHYTLIEALPQGAGIGVIAMTENREWIQGRSEATGLIGWLPAEEMETLPLSLIPTAEAIPPTPRPRLRVPQITALVMPNVIGTGGATGRIDFYDAEDNVTTVRFEAIYASGIFTTFALGISPKNGSFRFNILGCGNQRVTLAAILIDSQNYRSEPVYFSFQCRS